MILQWAGSEGWNPGIEDDTLFHATDPSGFLISLVDDTPVAAVSVVKHTENQSFLGLYICLPEWRGTGVGWTTWQAGLASTDGRTVGLDGVVDQQANYRKSGFDYCFGNNRFSGVLAGVENFVGLNASDTPVQISPATRDDVAQIVDYDARVGGFARPRLFDSWSAHQGSRHLFVARLNGQCVGVTGLRKCVEGYKVGPWLADSAIIAMKLLHAASVVCGSENVMIDVPSSNSTSIELMQSLGLESIFDTARMYKGQAPGIDVERLFGVATLELG